MGAASLKSSISAIYRRYNGQVFFIPTNNWQLATSAIARSTRFVLSDIMFDQVSQFTDVNDFTLLYTARSHSPVLWYTPSGVLGDEVYNFLHTLPGIGNIIILHKRAEQGLRTLDKGNLEAMVRECWQWGSVPSFFAQENIPLYEFPANEVATRASSLIESQTKDDLDSVGLWLNLNRNLNRIAPKQLKQLPGVVIVVPATPHFACTLVPLAAYIQGTLLYMNLQDTFQSRFVNELASKALEDDRVDEIWLAGPTSMLKPSLEQIIETERQKQRRFDRTVIVRVIPGDDHFAVSEQAAVLLLTYRYLDSILIEALIRHEGREQFFEFLSSDRMHKLYHHCNRVLDLADQLRRKNYTALRNVHDVYWGMLEQERRSFLHQFQCLVPDLRRDTDNMVVVADYNADEPVPHNLIDAAAFAARRGVPLLLLRPLSSEISYSIGSLMDKTEDQLDKLNKLQMEQSKLDAEQTFSEDLSKADREWQELRLRIESIKKETDTLRRNLRDNVYKTGEVLYESLVPLAVRKTMHLLNPGYLAVFIQDPSLPIELIRESDSMGIQRNYGGSYATSESVYELLESHEDSFDRFWSLRYAIGHISSIDLYTTNLTSNNSFFIPRASLEDEIQVLLCSNPTRDLFFSGLEAKKIAELFEGWEKSASSKQVKLIVHYLTNERQGNEIPTRDNLIAAMRRGYDIIHYSGHAFFDNVLPGRSGLLLSDDVLTAADVRFMLELSRSPVIYASACSAGRIKGISSRFTGLASAFIRAGAAGYISSIWSIDDRDAGTLAAEYYQTLLKNHCPIGECLRTAKLHARSDFLQTKSDFITWASLVLYGDPTLTIFQSTAES
jgi:CHAT domain